MYPESIDRNKNCFRKQISPNMNNNDFRNYAVHHLGMNGLALDQYTSAVNSNVNAVSASYISPTIIEERQLNVA